MAESPGIGTASETPNFQQRKPRHSSSFRNSKLSTEKAQAFVQIHKTPNSQHRLRHSHSFRTSKLQTDPNTPNTQNPKPKSRSNANSPKNVARPVTWLFSSASTCLWASKLENRMAILGTMPVMTAPRPLYSPSGVSLLEISRPVTTKPRFLAPRGARAARELHADFDGIWRAWVCQWWSGKLDRGKRKDSKGGNKGCKGEDKRGGNKRDNKESNNNI